VVGLVSGGALVVWVGAGVSLAASAGLFAVAAVLISLVRVPGHPDGGTSTSVASELREGWDEFRSRQWLWVVVVQFSLLVLALQAAHGVLGPVVAKSELGGAGAWTAVLAGEAVGMIGGVLLALRVRPHRPILVATFLSAAPALLYLCLGMGAPIWLTVLAAVVMGVSFDLFGVLWQTTMQREIPEEALSRVSSYDAFGSMVLGPLGLLLAGPAAAVFGAHVALLGCAVLIVMTSAAALCAPGVRNLTAPTRRDGPASDPMVTALVASGDPVSEMTP
jgi:predicted MFS family arabinose efflux permease